MPVLIALIMPLWLLLYVLTVLGENVLWLAATLCHAVKVALWLVMNGRGAA